MLLLTSTSDLIQVVTSTAALIKAHADFMDFSSPTTFTPGRTNTAIASAATTTVVASPGSSIQRNVKGLSVFNVDPLLSCLVTIQHSDGTTPIAVWSGTLTPATGIEYTESGSWINIPPQGLPLGQQLMAASLAVAIALDQASVSVIDQQNRIQALILRQQLELSSAQGTAQNGFVPSEFPTFLTGA